MKKNMGSTDRIIRLVLGIAIVVFGIITESLWGLAGLIFIGTALMSRCPLYLPFGLSTCSTEQKK